MTSAGDVGVAGVAMGTGGLLSSVSLGLLSSVLLGARRSWRGALLRLRCGCFGSTFAFYKHSRGPLGLLGFYRTFPCPGTAQTPWTHTLFSDEMD